MRRAFSALAALLLLVVVAQFFLAAAGAFDPAPTDQAFGPHLALGWVVFFLPVVLAVVGALARLPGRLIGPAALVAGLASVQVLIAAVARAAGADTTAGQLIFGLHAVNGLAILAVSGLIVRRGRTQILTDRIGRFRRRRSTRVISSEFPGRTQTSGGVGGTLPDL